jgi:F0F1-type ATP synthase membrane subunit b/b'
VTQYEQAKTQAQAQVEQAKARGGEYQKQAESYLADAEKRLDDAKRQAMSAVDNFDRTVEAKAAQAKGGILSWFGGK